MAIQSIFNITPIGRITENGKSSETPTPYEAQQSFGTYLKDAIQEVNTKQQNQI